MDLRARILSDDASIAAIGEALDGMSHEDRLAACYSLGRKHQRRLYELAAAAPAITLEHFVPSDKGPREPVVHYGKNSLPVFRKFQKRFCRPASDEATLYGYNEGVLRPVIGPGYFVTHDTTSSAEWTERGAQVIDYFMTPSGNEDVVPGWPTVKPNSKGLQMFVYNKTRDFMRRVSEHVSIGAAFKHEKALGAYFILCREP